MRAIQRERERERQGRGGREPAKKDDAKCDVQVAAQRRLDALHLGALRIHDVLRHLPHRAGQRTTAFNTRPCSAAAQPGGSLSNLSPHRLACVCLSGGHLATLRGFVRTGLTSLCEGRPVIGPIVCHKASQTLLAVCTLSFDAARRPPKSQTSSTPFPYPRASGGRVGKESRLLQ